MKLALLTFILYSFSAFAGKSMYTCSKEVFTQIKYAPLDIQFKDFQIDPEIYYFKGNYRRSSRSRSEIGFYFLRDKYIYFYPIPKNRSNDYQKITYLKLGRKVVGPIQINAEYDEGKVESYSLKKVDKKISKKGNITKTQFVKASLNNLENVYEDVLKEASRYIVKSEKEHRFLNYKRENYIQRLSPIKQKFEKDIEFLRKKLLSEKEALAEAKEKVEKEISNYSPIVANLESHYNDLNETYSTWEWPNNKKQGDEDIFGLIYILQLKKTELARIEAELNHVYLKYHMLAKRVYDVENLPLIFRNFFEKADDQGKELARAAYENEFSHLLIPYKIKKYEETLKGRLKYLVYYGALIKDINFKIGHPYLKHRPEVLIDEFVMPFTKGHCRSVGKRLKINTWKRGLASIEE